MPSPGVKNNRWPPVPLIRDLETIEVDPDQRTLTERYTTEAIAFINDVAGKDAKSRQPFFLYLPHTMPHVPLYASDNFKDKSPRGLFGDVVEKTSRMPCSCSNTPALVSNCPLRRNSPPSPSKRRHR